MDCVDIILSESKTSLSDQAGQNELPI